MEFSRKQLEQALYARDARFDGRFFIGVTTTGIYCRPVCLVKQPKAQNVLFFSTAAAASEAGYRPCLRCRPETSPGTPAWMGTSTTVKRALQLIGEGALDEATVEQLSDRLGVTTRHLSRLFAQHLGASPISVAQTRRLHFAKKLLDETDLSMTDIAMSSGYQSVRRFNDHIKKVYDRTPSELRRHKKTDRETGVFTLRLGFRQPFEFSTLLNFLRLRAIPGVETVDEISYYRTIEIEGVVSSIRVTRHDSDHVLLLEVNGQHPGHLFQITSRVRKLFDLDADPMAINDVLERDTQLKSVVRSAPGQRVPGSWSSFEIAVRAIVGQQVSVKGATTVMGRIALSYGRETSAGLCFPGPAELSRLDPEALSMPRARAQAIKDLSHLVATGAIIFDASADAETLMTQLTSIKGIGPWTAQYIAMRAVSNPDAFLDGDLVLLKVAARFLNIHSRPELLSRAEQWRPWRAYAGMHLWRIAAELESN